MNKKKKPATKSKNSDEKKTESESENNLTEQENKNDNIEESPDELKKEDDSAEKISDNQNKENDNSQDRSSSPLKKLNELIKDLTPICSLIGAILSIFLYFYYQGYYKYFQIDDEWINIKSFNWYRLLWFVIYTVVALIPVMLTELPFFLKTKHFLLYEIGWFTLSNGILISLPIFADPEQKIIILIIILIELLIALVIFIFMLFSLDFNNENKKNNKWFNIVFFALIFGFIACIIIGYFNIEPPEIGPEIITVFFISWNLIIAAPFCGKLYDHIENKVSNNKKEKLKQLKKKDSANTQAQPIGKTKEIFVFAFSIFILFAFIGFSIHEIGSSNAQSEKEFSVIYLDEYETYDDYYLVSIDPSDVEKCEKKLNDENLDNDEKQLLIDKIKKQLENIPFIQVVPEDDKDVIRRVVNAHVIIASNEDKSIVLNAYVDKENNTLYYFSREQRTIERNDSLIHIIRFDHVNPETNNSNDSQNNAATEASTTTETTNTTTTTVIAASSTT